MQPIHEQIVDIARRIFHNPTLELTDETTAADVERWDSLTHITFIVEVEKRFQVKFRNAEIARLKNIGDLKKLVAKYSKAAA
jgi:acyl carrier protein